MSAADYRHPSAEDVARASIERLRANPPQLSPMQRQRIAILLWGGIGAGANQAVHTRVG